MSVFKQLIAFSNFLDTEEDYTLFILGLGKLCRDNIDESPQLQLIADIVANAILTKQETGSYKNYYSQALATEMQKIPMEELVWVKPTKH